MLSAWTETNVAVDTQEGHQIQTEGLFGMTSWRSNAESRGKSSLTEKEAKAVQGMEKALYIELRN